MNRSLIDDKELARLGPEQLVVGYTRTPLMRFAAIAFVLHVLVIGGTSVPFIYYTWINPEAGAARQAEIEAARKAKLDAELAGKRGKSMSDAKAATDGDGEAGDTPDAGAAEDGEPELESEKSAIEQELEKTLPPPSLDDLLNEPQ